MRRIGLPETWDAREADRGFMASLATLAFVSLGLELVVAGTVLTATGSLPAATPLGWQCLEWFGIGAVWLLVARALVAWSRRRGVDPLPGATPEGGQPGTLDHRRWRGILLCFVAAVVLALVLPGMLDGSWAVAPVERYTELFAGYGGLAWLAMLAWVVRLVGRCAVVTSLLAYSHRAVSELVDRRALRWVPWGGLVTGVLMAAVALLDRGQAAALTTLLVYLLLGVVHVRSGESLRVTALFAVPVLALL